MLLTKVTWHEFEDFLEGLGKTRYRLAYKDGSLDYATHTLGHQNKVRFIGYMIFIAAMEFGTPLRSGGSTTLKQSQRCAGIEPDDCCWIKQERHMRGKKEWSPLIDPPPDLAVEVNVATCLVDRVETLAALRVPEVWRFDDETLKVLIRGPNGKYKQKAKSSAFPTLPMDGFARFVKKLGSTDEVSLLHEFSEWLRANVVMKKAGGEWKNGRR